MGYDQIAAQLRFPPWRYWTPAFDFVYEGHARFFEFLRYDGVKLTIQVVPKFLPPTIGFTGTALTPNYVWVDIDRSWGGNEAAGNPMAGQYGFLDYTRDFTWVYKCTVDRPLVDLDLQQWTGGNQVVVEEEGPGWPTLFEYWDDESYAAEPWMTYMEEYVIWNWYDTEFSDVINPVLQRAGEDDDYVAEYMENLLLYNISMRPLKPDPDSSGYGDKHMPTRLNAGSAEGQGVFLTEYKWPGDNHAIINDLRKRFKLISGTTSIPGQKTVMDRWLDDQYGIIANSIYHSVVPKQFTAKMQKALPISESGLSAMVHFNNDPYVTSPAHAGFAGDPTEADTYTEPEEYIVYGD